MAARCWRQSGSSDARDTPWAMSQENVEIVREAWNAYRAQGIEGYVEYLRGGLRREDFPELPDSATYSGRKGGLDRYRHFADAWGSSSSRLSSSSTRATV